MHFIKLFLILFVISNFSYAQSEYTQKKDSLQKKLLTTSGDEKIKIYSDLVYITRKKEPLLSLDFFDQAVRITDTNKINPNTSRLFGMAALTYSHIYNYDKAIQYLLKATTLIDSTNLSLRVYFSNIASMYYFKKDYSNSIKYILHVLSLHRDVEDKNFKAFSYTNISESYIALDSLEKASKYALNAYKLYVELNRVDGQFRSLYYLIDAELHLNNFITSKMYLDKLEKLLIDKNKPYFVMVRNSLLGKYNWKIGNYNKAIKYIKESLKLSSSLQEEPQLFTLQEITEINYLELSKVYELKKDFATAYKYELKYKSFRDSIFDDNLKARIRYFEKRYVAERRLSQSRAQQLENEEQQKLLLIILLLFLLVVFSFGFYNSIHKKKLNLKLTQKNRDLELINTKFLGLFEQSEDGIRLIDKNGVIILWNRANETLTGISKDDAINKYIWDILFELEKDINPKSNKELFQAETLKLTSKEHFTPYRYEHKIQNKKKEIKVISTTVFPISTQDNFLIGAISRDISKIKEYEHEIIQAKEIAENSNKIKSEFLAQMSHEIRTPINTLLSFTNLIKSEVEDMIDEDLKEGFSHINHAGVRIIRTVDLLLNMAEIQTGTYEIEKKNIDLYEDVISPAIDEFNIQLKQAKLSISVEKVTPDCKLIADEYSLSQIVHNLLSNAIKYTLKGFVKIIINRDEIKNLYFEIEDTGVGINEDYLEDIFEPFTQEEQGYTRKFEGNGLGLSLVKNYCELNNATITVESKKNVGSKFKVTFLKS